MTAAESGSSAGSGTKAPTTLKHWSSSLQSEAQPTCILSILEEHEHQYRAGGSPNIHQEQAVVEDFELLKTGN